MLYLCMALEAGSKADEWFRFNYSTAGRYHIPRSTLHRGTKELEKAGFIERRRPNDGWKTDTFAPWEYRLITEWKNK